MFQARVDFLSLSLIIYILLFIYMCMCVSVWTPVWITRVALHHYFYYNCLVKVHRMRLSLAPCFCASRTQCTITLQQIGRLRRNYFPASPINSRNPSVRTCECNFTTLFAFPENPDIFCRSFAVSSPAFVVSPWKMTCISLQNKLVLLHRFFLVLLNYYPRARSKSPRFVKRLRVRSEF